MSTAENFEKSSFFARPVELYHFQCGDKEYLCTSSSKDVEHNGRTYKAIAVRRGEIELVMRGDHPPMTIEIDTEADVVSWHHPEMPSNPATLRILRAHRGSSGAIALWAGKVSGVTVGGASSVIECDSVMASLQRMALRYTYSAQCQHHVYGPGCGLDIADWSDECTISAVSSDGLVLTVSDLPERDDGYYQAGLVVRGATQRMITEHDDAAKTVALIAPIPGLKVGDSITVAKGCMRSRESCKSFDNFSNFYGFSIPEVDPFSDGLEPIRIQE